MKNTYSSAGVDIEKGERFAEFIGNIKSRAVSKGLGGFAGGVELDIAGCKNPVLLSTTDGVGTKLLVARKLKKFDTLGIDLVAMCVNDLVVCGAFPLCFLDYIACSRINEGILKEIIKGIVSGCEEACTKLTGGETAEMPDLYSGDDFDLAGFSSGIVEKSKLLPHRDRMSHGDIILGLPSSGIHSNGLSLARKVLPSEKIELWEELLVPTKIYVKEMKLLLSTEKILSAAHITGGGLINNIIRVIPENLKPELSFNWSVPDIFKSIKSHGNISEGEMRRVFNMGIGMALIVKNENLQEILGFCSSHKIEISQIGRLSSG